MEKKDLIANDPMETRLMAFCETVNKVSRMVITVVVIVGVFVGIGAAFFASDMFGDMAGFLGFAIGFVPSILAAIVIDAVKDLICLWLENQTEMHCYVRTQTEILAGRSEKK